MVGLSLLTQPNKIMSLAKEAVKSKALLYYGGILNIMLSTLILYTAFFFHPAMLATEWVLAILGILIGLKGLTLAFITDNLSNKFYPGLIKWAEGKIQILGSLYIVLAGLGTYLITTI